MTFFLFFSILGELRRKKTAMPFSAVFAFFFSERAGRKIEKRHTPQYKMVLNKKKPCQQRATGTKQKTNTMNKHFLTFVKVKMIFLKSEMAGKVIAF
jgi:hypothetical protein